MVSHGESTGRIFLYVGKFGGHEHACRRSKSNQIGTNRIPMMRTIDLKRKMVLGEIWKFSRLRYQQICSFYVGVFGGHEHACRPSISNQIGTNRIPMIKSIILKGQNQVLTYPGVGLRAKY